MRVRNKNMALQTLLSRDGRRSFVGDHHGVFDVDSDYGNWLCGTKGWEPADGARLPDVFTEPPGAAQRAHREAERLEELAKQDARADTQEPQTLNPTPPPAQPETEPAPPEKATDEEEGPDLDRLTKSELLSTADKYRLKGYSIPALDNSLSKSAIKLALQKALYSED